MAAGLTDGPSKIEDVVSLLDAEYSGTVPRRKNTRTYTKCS